MTESQPPANYDAGQISVLEGLEAVRKRPAMYIGDTDVRGVHHLIWEVVDNAVDEALAGFATHCIVTLHDNGSVSVEDDGRGIPVDIHPDEGVPAVEVVLTKLHAGGKFGDGAYKVSGGLHGVGISCVNALAEALEVTVHKHGKIHRMSFERGAVKDQLEVIGETDRTGTTVRWNPDPQIFSSLEHQHSIVQQRMRETAYLMGSRGLRLELNDERTATHEVFEYPAGLKAFVLDANKGRTPLHPEVLTLHGTEESKDNPGDVYEVELAMQWTDGYQENVFPFVNNIHTRGGGTHLTGLRSSLARALGNYARKGGLLKDNDKGPSGDDFREGLTAVLSLKVPNPQFEGQTKDKLGNREAQGIVEAVVGRQIGIFLEENHKIAKAIIQKAVQARAARDAARKARDLVRRKSALASGSLPGKLADCQSKVRDETELFIVEGDSAGGPAKMGRDRRIQAILPIKGKILNVEKAPLDKIFAHQEILLIVQALGCGISTEMNPEKVRYGKTIIMTDADVDGSHIRTLLLTFFYRYMRPLIDEGRLYIAQPPLYKVSKGKKYKYLIHENALRDYLVEIGTAQMTVHDTTSGKTFEGAALRELAQTLTDLDALKGAIIPIWAPVRYADLVDRWDGKKLPDWWARADRIDHFFESLEEYEDFLELRRGMISEELVVYGGPESGVMMADSHVQGAKLMRANDVAECLERLATQGIAVQGGGPWVVTGGKESKECTTVTELASITRKGAESGVDIQRYKGLGEMNADQLWESTMDPETRTLLKVSVDESLAADQIFTILMSDEVDPRRKYIEEHALEITNLDI
ncbi:MAG: DNA topoisomerase (ATP-hydrolyzing) subunit B [bacterium]